MSPGQQGRDDLQRVKLWLQIWGVMRFDFRWFSPDFLRGGIEDEEETFGAEGWQK